MRKHGEISVTWVAAKNTFYYRVQEDGKRKSYSTGIHFNNKAGESAALAKAKAIHAAKLSGNKHKLADVVKRPGFAKCGEVADIYRVHGPEASRTKSLSRFAAYVKEVTKREDWEEQSTHLVLTAKALRDWIELQEKQKSKKKKKGVGDELRSESGIHTDVQTIKSVVARKRFYLFEKLKLPDLTDFWAVSGGSTSTEGYQPIDRLTLARMDKAAGHRLRKQNARVWAIYWIMRKAGLRNEEVEHLKWSWVDWQTDGTADLVLIKREDWKPKGRSGRVPMRSRMLKLIKAALGGDGEFVIPRSSKTEAYDLAHYGINEFVRQFIPDGQKGAYNLRKEYGAQIAGRDGIEVASRLLRHRDIQTTFNHYHNLIKRPKPL
jgi:integrase